MPKQFFKSIYFCGLLAVLAGADSANAQSGGDQWDSVTKSESKIDNLSSKLTGFTPRYVKREASNYSHTLHMASWGGNQQKFRKSIVLYFDLSANYHFSTNDDPKKLIGKLTAFESQSVRYGERASCSNQSLEFRTIRFVADNTPCFSFVQEFGMSWTDDQSVGTKKISGYYCAAKNGSLTQSDINDVCTNLVVKSE